MPDDMPNSKQKDGVFISCVSDEFETDGAPCQGLRGQLRGYLARTGSNVRVQEDFPQTADDTVMKLAREICPRAVVIHLVGENPGSIADPAAVAEYLKDEPTFLESHPKLWAISRASATRSGKRLSLCTTTSRYWSMLPTKHPLNKRILIACYLLDVTPLRSRAIQIYSGNSSATCTTYCMLYPSSLARSLVRISRNTLPESYLVARRNWLSWTRPGRTER